MKADNSRGFPNKTPDMTRYWTLIQMFLSSVARMGAYPSLSLIYRTGRVNNAIEIQVLYTSNALYKSRNSENTFATNGTNEKTHD